jgi:hypothetical protein
MGNFKVNDFLATIGRGRAIVEFAKKQTIYAQGAACDAVLHTEGQGETHRPLDARQGSHDSHIDASTRDPQAGDRFWKPGPRRRLIKVRKCVCGPPPVRHPRRASAS